MTGGVARSGGIFLPVQVDRAIELVGEFGAMQVVGQVQAVAEFVHFVGDVRMREVVQRLLVPVVQFAESAQLGLELFEWLAHTLVVVTNGGHRCLHIAHRLLVRSGQKVVIFCCLVVVITFNTP